MCGYPPFGAQVILNGHEWVERFARRKRVVAVKNGNCFKEGSEFSKISRLAAELNRVENTARLHILRAVDLPYMPVLWTPQRGPRGAAASPISILSSSLS
jgi:hypothetical protein